jgi:two-component system NarL family sensor kinase
MSENKKNIRVMADAQSRAIGRLIEAQDHERMGIARELHDDIGASLAEVGIDLFKAGQAGSGSSGEKHPDIQQICEKLQEIGSRVSRLSNRLNPPMLRYFGLAKAIEIECREFSKECRIPVSCSCDGIPAQMDSVLKLNFYWVVKEALRNAGKHSHATSVIVNARVTSNELTLAISDDGAGFDVEQINAATGLGLISMRERIRLIGGEFEIRSQPGQGVKILCRARLIQSSE